MHYFFIFLLAVFYAVPVSAQEGPVDGDACGGSGQPPAGAFTRKNSSDGFQFMFCNGTNWVLNSQFTDDQNILFFPGPGAMHDIAIGTSSLHSSLPTKANSYQGDVFIGYLAGSQADRAEGLNVLIGNRAGSSARGSANTLIGAGAGGGITTGGFNTLLGRDINFSDNASYNVSVGSLSGGGTGIGNTIVGHGSGNALTSGSRNIVIGLDTQTPGGGNASYSLNIGNTIYGNMINAATDGTGTARIGINEPSPGAELHVKREIFISPVRSQTFLIDERSAIFGL